MRMKKKNCHSGEYVSLKKYFESKVKNIYHTMVLNSKLIERSTKLAAKSLETRLEHMNEFRAAMSDQSKHYLTKQEFTIQHERVMEDIKILRESKANLEGKASTKSVMIAYIISGIGLLISLITLILKFI